MAPKVNKEKGVAYSRHGTKRARRTSEEEHEDVRMTPQLWRQYGIHWVTEQEEDEMARVDSDIESIDDNKEDSEMEEAALFPHR
ncbi:hypothetical protein HAX54_042790 [Datura stramonium]|uniref:Uncharacterized protein n=1 Tax=Datura stramonium TaxID=4076 RepID=A0ABS8SMJ1_DATST|nr:hypothetical protein [Datura stramonium]